MELSMRRSHRGDFRWWIQGKRYWCILILLWKSNQWVGFTRGSLPTTLRGAWIVLLLASMLPVYVLLKLRRWVRAKCYCDRWQVDNRHFFCGKYTYQLSHALQSTILSVPRHHSPGYQTIRQFVARPYNWDVKLADFNCAIDTGDEEPWQLPPLGRSLSGLQRCHLWTPEKERPNGGSWFFVTCVSKERHKKRSS